MFNSTLLKQFTNNIVTVIGPTPPGTGVIALAIVGWFGYSSYDLHSSNQERAVAEVNYDSVKDYLSTLSVE